MSAPAWKVGDRVLVELPNRATRWSRLEWFSGTVDAVDPPELPPGVRVSLDQVVNGVDNCYATHSELEALWIERMVPS